MTALFLATIAGAGVYLLFTAMVMKRRRLILMQPNGSLMRRRAQIRDAVTQAGWSASEFMLSGILLVVGGVFGWLLLGGMVAPALIGVFGASFPLAASRSRRQRRRTEAAEAWPRMIEQIRLLCGSLGRPIPQALLEVGRQGPVELRAAFAEAEREWLLSTDFTRTVAVLKERLSDPTADATCETLLVAHTIGGGDIDRRLAALAEDRHLDLQGRKDAKAKQAGVRFARRFVLLVPVGMAFAGLSIGNGRASYETSDGQLGVGVAIAMLAGCWWWAGRLIRLPQEERVLRA